MCGALSSLALLCLVALVVRAGAIPAQPIAHAQSRRVSSETCSSATQTNITHGVVAGATKFVVTESDCCEYCSSLGGCVAAVYASYYCTPYSQVQSTAPNVPQATTLFLATPAPTPVPPVPPPSGFGVLTACDLSETCEMISLYTCGTTVIPMNTCTLDVVSKKKIRSLFATHGDGGITVDEYGTPNCSGARQSSTLYPPTCTWYENAAESRQGRIASWTNQTGVYVVKGEQCSEASCPSGSCNVIFSGPAGVCLDGTASSSSASLDQHVTGGGGGGGGGMYFCLPEFNMIATFSYPTLEQCEANVAVLGTALPINQCYYNAYDENFQNYCNPV